MPLNDVKIRNAKPGEKPGKGGKQHERDARRLSHLGSVS